MSVLTPSSILNISAKHPGAQEEGSFQVTSANESKSAGGEEQRSISSNKPVA